MAKSAFNVVAIRPGMELKYREFWIENKNTSSDGTELHPAMLADTDIVEARSKTEAEALAKKKFPGRKIEVSRIG
jgi:hypothetical protein